MAIIIDGSIYQGTGSAEGDRLSIVIKADMHVAFAWDKEMVVTVDNEEHNVASLQLIGKYDDQIRVVWQCETEATRLERELEEKEEELAESNGTINSIRDAIEDFGTGLPTLSKLTAFLNAVKEAVHYGRNN